MPAWSRITAESQRLLISLLLAKGPISRADLARLSQLNKPTISNLVSQLIDEGIVREIGSGESTGGRKPILLEMNNASRLVAGVEVDAFRCRTTLTNLAGELLGMEEAFFSSPAVDSVVNSIAATIDALFRAFDRSALLGCGVAIPGLVDPINDTVDGDARLGWRHVPLRALLETRLGVPVLVTDRGKAAGLGEMWVLGKERSHDLIYLYLGTGVAGAVVLGSDVHWGVSNIAGEIGHMTVDPNGPLCSCGNRGCLESLVSTQAIVERYRSLRTLRLETSERPLDDQATTASSQVDSIGQAAIDQEPLAVETVVATARWLGIAIANLINTLNPAFIVLGGPTSEWGTVLTDAIDLEIDARALPQSRRAAQVVVGQARDQAVPLGAAVLVLQQAASLITDPKRSSHLDHRVVRP